MSPPRLQFTLGRLIQSIAGLAVCMATLRTPFWPLVPAIGIILVGFAVDRARGGAGIYGAMAAGVIGFSAISFIAYVTVILLIGWQEFYVPHFLVMLFGGGLLGGAWGIVVGYWTRIIVNIFSRVDQAGGPPT